ncbi:hypothetical protein M7775_18130 [Sporomusa sphaeroides DSM 2875]|uniref:hypothetical protein n=1 Tax=Sporomusa sphaeroides TaxID=47679 RepID=UPI00202EB478|nr:hypothetical protein [Sporomusa sphaeroides]MCM0760475.1 hypothetical protein [Sporomusa sphaeroides DSM 2875]
MMTIEIDLNTREKRVIESNPHPDDVDVTILAPLLVQDVIEKMIKHKLLNPATIKNR